MLFIIYQNSRKIAAKKHLLAKFTCVHPVALLKMGSITNIFKGAGEIIKTSIIPNAFWWVLSRASKIVCKFLKIEKGDKNR